MKTYHKRLLGLLILSVAQIIFPLFFISAKEKVISDGKEYKFQITPVDPYDFFQGRYVNLNVVSLTFPSEKLKEFHKNDIVFVEFKEDSLGSKIKSISKEKTMNSLKLKLNSDPKKQKNVFVNLPFKRFYLEENKSKKVEQKLARDTTDKNFVHVKILNGEFVITDISSNGKSLVSGKLLFKGYQ
jgi:uncharacterized membrane-anchored protein